MSSPTLAINTAVRLRSDYELLLLGLCIYKNDDAKTACVAAFKVGYRNEAHVGEAVRESGIPRSQVCITSQIGNNEHGYDPTLGAVYGSLKNFGFDYLDFMLIHRFKSDRFYPSRYMEGPR